MNKSEINNLVEVRIRHRNGTFWPSKRYKESRILYHEGFINEEGNKSNWKAVWQKEKIRDAAHEASDPNRGKNFTDKEWGEKSPDARFHTDKLIYIIPIIVLILMYTWLILSAVVFPKPVKRRVRKYKAPRAHLKEKNQPKITPIDVQEDTDKDAGDYESSSSSDGEDDDQIKSGQLKIKASRIGGGKNRKVAPSPA